MTQQQPEQATITGVFPDEGSARRAIQNLHGRGYRKNDVQLLTGTNPEQDEPGEVSAKTVTQSRRGFFIGLIAGAVLGAVVGFFLNQGGVRAGIELALLLGPFTMTALCAVFGAALGALAGGMTGLSETRQAAKGLVKAVQHGYSLVTVRHNDPRRAEQDLRSEGALEVHIQPTNPTSLKSEV